MTVEKKLLDNGKVEVIETTERDRYVGYCEYDEAETDLVIEDFKENNKVWIGKNREGFEKLATDESWEPESKSVESDIDLFQKYLDETYGKDKYEAYALGAYVHGMVSFAFNKSDDTRCRWDSGTCGFVGISKELKDMQVIYLTLGTEVLNACMSMITMRMNLLMKSLVYQHKKK